MPSPLLLVGEAKGGEGQSQPASVLEFQVFVKSRKFEYACYRAQYMLGGFDLLAFSMAPMQLYGYPHILSITVVTELRAFSCEVQSIAF